MKELVVLALCAVTVNAFYTRGSIRNQDEVFVIQESRIKISGEYGLNYIVKFPKSSGMVHLMMMDAFEGEMPTECGENGDDWTLSLYEGHRSCGRGTWDETFGEMLVCSGSTVIKDDSYVDKVFMLVRCEEKGLWGSRYELWKNDIPQTASSSRVIPSVTLMSLTSLLVYLRLF